MKDPLSHFHVYSSPGGLIVPLDIHIQGHLVISLSIPSHQMALEILLFESMQCYVLVPIKHFNRNHNPNSSI